MKTRFLESDNIYLRPLSVNDDLSEYESWLNDQEITRFMGSGKMPISSDSLKDYISKMNASKNDFLLGLFLCENEKHIGNLTLEHIEWIHRKAELGIVIGARDCLGKGYATEAVNMVLKHCFERLNLNKITAGMVSINATSQRLFEKCGFILEGTLKSDFFLEGKYYDIYRYGILRESYIEKQPLI